MFRQFYHRRRDVVGHSVPVGVGNRLFESALRIPLQNDLKRLATAFVSTIHDDYSPVRSRVPPICRFQNYKAKDTLAVAEGGAVNGRREVARRRVDHTLTAHVVGLRICVAEVEIQRVGRGGRCRLVIRREVAQHRNRPRLCPIGDEQVEELVSVRQLGITGVSRPTHRLNSKVCVVVKTGRERGQQ